MSRARPRTHVIRTAEQLRALRSPLRGQILAVLTLVGASSVKELAGRLGCSPESLHYHVRALRNAGLVREKGRRATRRREESIYEPVARRILADRSCRTPAFLDALEAAYRATLRALERNLARVLAFEGKYGRGRRKRASLRTWQVRLGRDGAKRVEQKIHELEELLHECDDPDAGETYSCTVAFHWMPPRSGH